MYKHRFAYPVFAILLLVAAAPAMVIDQPQFTISGLISTVQNPDQLATACGPNCTVSPGDGLTVNIYVDSATPDLSPFPEFGLYSLRTGINRLEIVFAGKVWSSTNVQSSPTFSPNALLYVMNNQCCLPSFGTFDGIAIEGHVATAPTDDPDKTIYLSGHLFGVNSIFVGKLIPSALPAVSTFTFEKGFSILGPVGFLATGDFTDNLPLMVGAITAPVDPVAVNTTINTSANFTDPVTPSIHTAVWDWGDNSTSPATVNETNGFGTVTGSHTFTAPGVYTVKVTVTNDDGDSDQSIFQFVVVYDPDGGFVTGGGWIDSPAGAYTLDPPLTGRANFGFVSKYKKGATVPSGQTEFQFQVADLSFHSTSYEWLVVAGSHAKFKGSGTINGSGDYGFMLTATDGQINGGGGVDKFRIKIWDKATNTVIYDNQLGDADNADASDAIENGSITIHQ